MNLNGETWARALPGRGGLKIKRKLEASNIQHARSAENCTAHSFLLGASGRNRRKKNVWM